MFSWWVYILAGVVIGVVLTHIWDRQRFGKKIKQIEAIMQGEINHLRNVIKGK